MTPEDFVKLSVGRQIYLNGTQETIMSLWIDKENPDPEKKRCIRLNSDSNNDYQYWDNICSACSLEKPKTKRKMEWKGFIHSRSDTQLSEEQFKKYKSISYNTPATLTFEIEE